MPETTRLSSKGQIVIPKRLRDAHGWEAGQEFVVHETEEGILLEEKRAFARTELDDVAGSLPYAGPAKSLQEMEQAIRRGATSQEDSTGKGTDT